MNDFIYRLILSALSLMLFYGIYRLLLSRLALLNVSRTYLLITMVIALLLVLPWQGIIEDPAEIAFVVNLDMATIIPYPTLEASAGAYNWWNLAFYTYLIPASLLLLFFLYSNLRLFFLLRKGERINSQIIIIEHETLPFSWFGQIVMSQKDYESRHAESIIAHELTHIRQYHFIDLLLAETMIVLQWFNPAAWAYRRAVRDMHEYLADKGTISSGCAITEYQHLLATLAGPVTAGILSNNIKHSTLKNRFTMMTKTNNGKFAVAKLIAAFGVALLIGWSTLSLVSIAQEPKPARKTLEIDQESVRVNTISIYAMPEDHMIQSVPDKDGQIFVVVEEPPQFPGGEDARIRFISENIKYPEEARTKGIQGTVFITFVVEADGSVTNAKVLRGIGDGCDEEALRVVNSMPKWVPGKQRGENVRVQFNMPIRFSLE